MATLFDMIAGADNGRAMDLLARQFDISRQQAELAVDALLPAFSQGLRRNASDPAGLGAFLQAIATGQHAKYFEDAGNAFRPAGIDEGNGILGHLFGSKDMSRAIAQQAAQATGLGQDMLKQMLPGRASMIRGGWSKQTTSGASQAGAANTPRGQILEQMMGGGMRTPRPEAPQPGPNPFDNAFGRMFEEVMRGSRPETNAGPQAGRNSPNAQPSGRSRSSYDELFGEMFETGRKTQESYQKGVESIFDQFLKGMDRNRNNQNARPQGPGSDAGVPGERRLGNERTPAKGWSGDPTSGIL